MCGFQRDLSMSIYMVSFITFSFIIVVSVQRRTMTGAVRIPFLNKTIKVFQAYSLVESSQLSRVDWICLIIYTLTVIFLYCIQL